MGAKNKGLFFGKVVLGVWGFDLYHTRGVRKREEERTGGREEGLGVRRGGGRRTLIGKKRRGKGKRKEWKEKGGRAGRNKSRNQCLSLLFFF